MTWKGFIEKCLWLGRDSPWNPGAADRMDVIGNNTIMYFHEGYAPDAVDWAGGRKKAAGLPGEKTCREPIRKLPPSYGLRQSGGR